MNLAVASAPLQTRELPFILPPHQRPLRDEDVHCKTSAGLAKHTTYVTRFTSEVTTGRSSLTLTIGLCTQRSSLLLIYLG